MADRRLNAIFNAEDPVYKGFEFACRLDNKDQTQHQQRPSYVALLLIPGAICNDEMMTTTTLSIDSPCREDLEEETTLTWMRSPGVKEDSNTVLVDFDDGHIPEIFKSKEANDSVETKDLNRGPNPTRLAISTEYHGDTWGKPSVNTLPCRKRLSCPQVQVFDNQLDPNLVDALYKYTKQQELPWGTYVTLQQVNEQLQADSPASFKRDCENTDPEAWQHHLALHASAGFMKAALATSEQIIKTLPAAWYYNKQHGDTTTKDDSIPSLWTKQDQSLTTTSDSKVHGVAVWALAASEGSEVPYHLDYAEQVRYLHNIVVPPVLAGTLHCSRLVSLDEPTRNNGSGSDSLGTIRGGNLCIHMGGLEHYHKHGYKGNKYPVAVADTEMTTINNDAPPKDTLKDGTVRHCTDGWVRIPYQYNRMTVMSGQLPHLSTRIHSLPQQPTQTMRVIVGFNVFLNNVGELVQKAPEHSHAFRRLIAQHKRRQQSSSSSLKTLSCDQTLSLSTIQSNPKLRKLLILAKRRRFREEWLKARQNLDDQILATISQQTDSKTVCMSEELGRTTHLSRAVTVQDLLDQFGTSTVCGGWPSQSDLQVHIYHGWLERKWALLAPSLNDEEPSRNVSGGLLDTRRQEEVLVPVSPDPRRFENVLLHWVVAPVSPTRRSE